MTKQPGLISRRDVFLSTAGMMTLAATGAAGQQTAEQAASSTAAGFSQRSCAE